jgi:hypothetical protein
MKYSHNQLINKNSIKLVVSYKYNCYPVAYDVAAGQFLNLKTPHYNSCS